jgi:hypothetical protein
MPQDTTQPHTRTVVARPGLIGYLQIAWAIVVETFLHPFSPSAIEVIRPDLDAPAPHPARDREVV